MSAISKPDQIQFQIPPGGEWFYTQAPMLDVYTTASENGEGEEKPLAVAWDNPRSAGKGLKMYGAYMDMTRALFMQNLLDTPTGNRHCYELLVENMPCKGYADVEWEGEEDPEHTELSRMVKAIRGKVHDLYSHEPKIYVCCGTRPTKEDPSVIKHSYHIVLDNIIFERNNDGQMKEFFTTIPGLTWMDGVEEKPMLDPRVYTKNRVFRLPHCTKGGSLIPFERISGDPLLDEFGMHDFGRDVQAVLPFFICNPDTSSRPDCKFVPTPPLLLEQVSKKRRAQSSPPSQPGEPIRPSNRLLPVPIQVVQHLLALAGDTVSKLGAVQYLAQEEQWQIQGDQRAQGRKCLLRQGVTHDSNNALLFVDRVETGFRVHYQCMAAGCCIGRLKPIIGYISMNTQTFDWQIALTPQQPMDDEDIMTDADQVQGEPEEPLAASSTAHQGPEDCNMADEGQGEDRMDEEEEESQEPPPDIELVDPPHDPENPDLNTYEMVKERFEKKCLKVKGPHCYVRTEEGHPEPYLHKHTDLIQCFANLKYWGYKGDKLMKLPFVPEWIQDAGNRTVEKIVVDPRNTMQNVYNMWKGFDAEKLPPLSEDRIHELIEPITKHFNDVVTSGVSDHTEFLHHYLANIVKRPWQKSQVAISLYGEQGCGKGIIFEFFRNKVLGSHCSYQTSRPEIDLFGRFANGAVNRVCIQVDEVKSLHDHCDQLKDFITNPTVNYEQKGKDSIVVSNFANLILTSNNANALTVSTDDRRFALFHCKSTHKGNHEYFTELGAHLERPEVARAYYQYLMAMDLGAYPISFQHKRPITEYYKEAQLNSIPVVSRFFSALVNSQYSETTMSFRVLYKKYEEFHTAGNYKYLMTETSFGRDAKRIQGVTTIRSSSTRSYVLDYDRIKKYLCDSKEFDPDAVLY